MANQNGDIKFKNQDEIFDFIEQQTSISKDTINKIIDGCPDDGNNNFLDLTALRNKLNSKDKEFDLYNFFDPYNTRCIGENQIKSFYGELADGKVKKLLKSIKPGTVPDWLIQSLFRIGFYADKKNNRYSFFNIYESLSGAFVKHYVNREYIKIVFKICGKEYLKNRIVDIYKQTNYLQFSYFQEQILDKIDDYIANDFFMLVQYYFSNRGVKPPSKTLSLSYDSYVINAMQLYPAFGFLCYEDQNYENKIRDLFFNVLEKYSECTMDNKKECLINILEMFVSAHLLKFSYFNAKKHQYCLPRTDEDEVENGMITNKTFVKVTHLIGKNEMEKLLTMYVPDHTDLLRDIICHKYFYLLFEPNCLDSDIFSSLIEHDIVDMRFIKNTFFMHHSSIKDNSLNIDIFKKLTNSPELYFLCENTKFVMYEDCLKKFDTNKIDDFDFLFDILLDDKFDCDNVVHLVLQKYFDCLKIDSTSKIPFNKLFQVCLNYLSFYDEFDYVFENVFLYYENDLLENDFILLLNNLTYKRPVISAQKTSREKFFNVRKMSIKHFEQCIAHKNFKISTKQQINKIIQFYVGDDKFQTCRQNFQLEKSVCYGKQKIENKILYLLLDKILQSDIEVDIRLFEDFHGISNLSKQEIMYYMKTKFGVRTEKLILALNENKIRNSKADDNEKSKTKQDNIQANKENNEESSQKKVKEEKKALKKEVINRVNIDHKNQEANKFNNSSIPIDVDHSDNRVVIDQNKNKYHKEKESEINKQCNKILGNKDDEKRENTEEEEEIETKKVKIEVEKNNKGREKGREFDNDDKKKSTDNKIHGNNNKEITGEDKPKTHEKEIKKENKENRQEEITEKNEEIDGKEQNNQSGFLKSFALCLFMVFLAFLAFGVAFWCLLQLKLVIKLLSILLAIFGTIILVIVINKVIRQIGTRNKNLTTKNYFASNSLKILNEQMHQTSINHIDTHTQIPQMNSQRDINKHQTKMLLSLTDI